jgi:tetratricopeptide (TPR) repeat protein
VVGLAKDSDSPLEAEMTKRIALFLFLAMTAIFSVSLMAQASARGNVKGEDGKPLVGATVELLNNENGRKFPLKTDAKGNYYLMGVVPGNSYKITIFAPDGKTVLWFANGLPMAGSGETVYDFDLKKEKEAALNAPENAEARKKYEEQKKTQDKVKNLNAMLAQARDQKKAGDFDGAVATMEQAVAIDQTHDVIYGTLADVYLPDKKYPESEEAYKKAIQLTAAGSKSLADYHSGLGLALVRQAKNSEALQECAAAQAVDAASAAQCFFNVGAVMTNQGAVDEANTAFDKAIAADPTKADAYYQKGVNLVGKAATGADGKVVPVPGTVEALNKYLELAPDGPNAQPAKDLLSYLGATVQTTFGKGKGAKK